MWSLCVFGVKSHLVYKATVLLQVSTVVALCAALIGGGAVVAEAEVTASAPAGVHWRASPKDVYLYLTCIWPACQMFSCVFVIPGVVAAAGSRQYRRQYSHKSVHVEDRGAA